MRSARPHGPIVSLLLLRTVVLAAVGVTLVALLQAVPALRPAASVTTSATPSAANGTGRSLSGFTQVSAGGDYSCGVGRGRLRCWGRNTWGQLGTGHKSAPVSSPTQVGTLTDWKRVAAGGASTCGIRTAQRLLYCWGLNNRGQLGDATRTVRLTPHRAGGLDWKMVSMGWFHVCGIHKTDQLVCWGDNQYGELGRGNTTQSVKMRRLRGSWSTVSAQGWSSCGIRTDHSLWCWGRNVLGGLGTGDFDNRTRPTRIGSHALRWRQVSLSWTHACAVRWDRSVWCWGRNDVGGVGDGTTTTRPFPTRVLGNLRARSLSTFEGGACAVTTAGPTYCWGDNHYGETGGSRPFYSRPHQRRGHLLKLSSGWFHTCATGAASATCWGSDDQGQLGRSVARTTQRTPTARPRASSPLSLRIATYNALGEAHSGPYHDADRFAPSRVRTEWVVRTLVNEDLDVVGMQETSSQQVSQILRAAGPGRLASFPNPATDKTYPETTLFWNPQRFALVAKGTVSSMFIRKPLPRPYVELRDRRTGREFWVMAIHNAGWDRPAQRRQAMLTQLAQIDKLRAGGVPVFYVGDFNEKQPAVCRVLKHGGLSSATGGHLTATGDCVPPVHMRIDWLFGPSAARWSGYVYSHQPMVRLTTDHGVAMASVQVP